MTVGRAEPRTRRTRTLPTDQINYMRNSVKAVVDAYDGTVTLYEWDTKDPILKAWEKAFPGIGAAEVDDLRRTCWRTCATRRTCSRCSATCSPRYHVTDPKTFYDGSDVEGAGGPGRSKATQAAAAVLPVGADARRRPDPVFSLTSVVRAAEAAEPRGVHLGGLRRRAGRTTARSGSCGCPSNTQIPGPAQIANPFETDQRRSSSTLLPFTQSNVRRRSTATC